MIWSFFLGCFEEVNCSLYRLVIDGIDALQTRGNDDAIEEGNLLIQKLNALLKDEKKLI